MLNFCSFWTRLFHRKGGLQNPTEDANITSPQDEAGSLERCRDDTHLHLPVLEGFIMQMDGGEPSISFDKLDQLKSVTGHASILEEHCKSALSSIPTGLLEGMDGKNKLPISDAVKQINDNYGCLTEERKRMHLDHRTVDRAEFIQKLKEREKELMYKRYEMEREAARMMEEEMALERLRRTLVAQARPVPKFDKLPIRLSPVSRVWESLNTELPSIAEENENTEEIAKGNVPEVWTSSFKRIPKKKFGNPKSSTRNNKEKQTPAVGASGVKCAESIYSRSNKPTLTGKTSLRGGPSLSEMEPKHNNTVSSITSFIPLVQQKQAAAALPVKRDIKVKALKAAEEENERKSEKEALKIQRARQKKENLRQLELQKKKKEEEYKKKEADMTARKKQREEKENKEKERKQMYLEEERKQHREYEQKFGAKKPEKDGKLQTTVNNLEKTIENNNFPDNTRQEQSYDIFPYKELDDEDDMPNSKPVPSWASKITSTVLRIAVRLFRPTNSFSNYVQSQLNPEKIFPPEVSCSKAEVLLPTKYQLKGTRS